MEISDFKGSRVLIVGLGLMGSSFAQALKELDFEIIGYDKDKKAVDNAFNKGIIHKGYTHIEEKVISRCDLVIVCLYLKEAINFIATNMKSFKRNCIITDIVGVKREIISSVEEVLREDVDYIPGHPMAGKERQGHEYGDKEIFKGKNYIITPRVNNRKENIDYLDSLFRLIGFNNIVYVEPTVHDEKIAFTSQLCHIIASAMVDINEDENITSFAGGSFQDMTRIAMINSTMWSELFFANKDKLVDVLNKFQDSIGFIKDLIEKEDSQLLGQLDIITKKREILNK